MPGELPAAAVRDLKNRRALLWVCQRHDLQAGRNPHGYDLAPAAAKLLYRDEISGVDRSLASQYWEAIWLEGAASPLLRALHESDVRNSERSIVELAGAADADVEVSADEFLPIWILPGLMDERKPLDAQYGTARSKTRERTAFSLANRLADFPARTLFVVGAMETADLAFLNEVLVDIRLLDFRVVVVWSADQPCAPTIDNPAIETFVWSGSTADFTSAIAAVGAPTSAEAIEWTIRLGKSNVQLPVREVRRISDRFVLVTERDLLKPDDFAMDEIRDFLHGRLDAWAGYAAGLVVPRAYRTGDGKTLSEEVLSALRQVSGGDEDNSQLVHVLEVPASAGAGSTTLARMAAFDAASEGYPVLVLRPEEVDIDRAAVSAFATSLAGLAAENELNPLPTLILLDREHHNVVARRDLAPALASEGRRAVILQVLPFEGDDSAETRKRRYSRLSPLTSRLTDDEVHACHDSFSKVVRRYSLSLRVPDIPEWEIFRQSTWSTPDGRESTDCTFWVALEFFLTSEMDFTDADLARDALGKWIERRMQTIQDDRMRTLVHYVASMSTLRMVSPLWTLLRPITGGTFSSELVVILRQLEGLVSWGTSQALEDEVLRFHHPSIAAEILRRIGVRDIRERINLLRPLLVQLSAGSAADRWVCESMAVTVSPSFEQKQAATYVDWDWRLDLFNDLPPLIRDRSKLILHHWARGLYLSAEVGASTIPQEERRKRLESAIDKLKAAIALPRREGRDEHPSHLYNTLGAAYSRYSRFLEESEGSTPEATESWGSACDAFERSIVASGGTNVDALLAFSRRLIQRVADVAVSPADVTEEQAADLLRALQLLDEAGEIVEELANPAPGWADSIDIYRQHSLHWLDRFGTDEGLQQLIQENPSIGYYCQARLRVQDIADVHQVGSAIDVLRQAEESGVKFGTRAVLFRLTLLRHHPQGEYDFTEQRRLYEILESMPESEPRPVDQFRHAVLCYQCGDYRAGAERFRRLRDATRRSDFIPPRLRDVLRNRQKPKDHWKVSMRVDRIWNEWRGEGFVLEINDSVPFRPRHFPEVPKLKQIIPCAVRFVFSGPKAVPEEFEQ
jgi:hypothetical protein